MTETGLDAFESKTLNLTALDQEKKKKVYEAAKKLFARFGFRKTTVDEIAENAGISKRTMYEVFRSKEQILAELVLWEAINFRRFSLGQLKHLDDAARKLRKLCELSASYFRENPFLGRVLADDAGLFSPFLGNELEFVEQGIGEIISRLLREGMAAGRFRPMDVAATTACVMVLFRGFTYERNGPTDGDGEWIAFSLRAIMQDPDAVEEIMKGE